MNPNFVLFSSFLIKKAKKKYLDKRIKVVPTFRNPLLVCY